MLIIPSKMLGFIFFVEYHSLFVLSSLFTQYVVMNKYMGGFMSKNTIIKGTFILTAAGFSTRIIGFFYRMFLSHTFGEEAVGLYQLIFPIYVLCYSFTTAGMQTAISRGVARKIAIGKKQDARSLTMIGLLSSFTFSLVLTLVLQAYAHEIALHILNDTRCTPLLIAVSYALPFASIHSCITGYYLGLKQTKIPAFSQLVEQLIRVGVVLSIWLFSIYQDMTVTIQVAVIGVVCGEIASSFFCIHHFQPRSKKPRLIFAKGLFSLAVPLTANRVLLNLLQSIEAISIPLQLQVFGYTSSDALKTYGVLTGMALPCILFPSAITNSVSTLLLPTIADIQATGRVKQLNAVIRKVTSICFFMGFICCAIFLVCGNWIGSALFHSPLASSFILTLAWMCPFLYTNATLLSMINGLGKANITFCINTLGLFIRIIGVWIGISTIGINGYLWSLLVSQLMISILCIVYLTFYIHSTKRGTAK